MLLSIFTILSVVFSVWRIYLFDKKSKQTDVDFGLVMFCGISLIAHGIGAMWAINASIESIAYLRVLKEHPDYSCGGAYRCFNIQSVAEAKYQLEQHRIGFYGFIVRAME